MSVLSFSDVAFSYPGTPVFERLDLTVQAGEMVGLLGPNGGGKTTLARLATGVLRPDRGRVRMGDEDVARIGPREMARRVAVVPQSEPNLFPFTVLEAVLMGRSPWLGGFGFESAADLAIARRALASVGARSLEDRAVTDLSGGERQSVLLARALAQDAEFLVLDEPTSHLDLKHQVETLRLVRALREAQGLTVFVISHDVNLLARFTDRLVLLGDGAVVADGPPRTVLEPGVLSRVYGTPVAVREVPGIDVPQVFPE
jgi:iron complex transport system ATP-binding protein